MRSLFLAIVLLVSGMSVPLSTSVAQGNTTSGPFMTLLFSRTEESAADAVAGTCVEKDTNVAILDSVVAPYLQSLGLTATGSIETGPTQDSSYWCAHYGETVAASWNLASLLSTRYVGLRQSLGHLSQRLPVVSDDARPAVG